MTESYDAIIVGAGVMGAAAAYHLARDGRRVLLLEQYGLGHARGSSHGPSRIIRYAYDGADYVALARAAFGMWRELEAECGDKLLTTTGGLDLAAPGVPEYDAVRATLRATGIPFEELSHAELSARFPQLRLPEGTRTIYQPDAGVLAADRCNAALIDMARRAGAVVRAGEPALRVAASGAGALAETAHATYHADRLVLSAGSWAGPLLRQVGLDLPLTLTKEQVLFFAPRDPLSYSPERFPIFIYHVAEPQPLIYAGFPTLGHAGVKLAYHGDAPVVQPGDGDDQIDQRRLAYLSGMAAALMPGLTDTLLDAVTCRYTNTPDGHFVVDRHPAHPQIVVASPCSGHGYKFAIAIGRMLADLAERGATDLPAELFRIDRPALRDPQAARAAGAPVHR